MKEYSTSEFAKAIGVSRRTLLNWEKENKIKPHSFSKNGYRIFTQNQVDEFLGIKKNKSIANNKKAEEEKVKQKNKEDQMEKIIEILERENQFLKDQLKQKDEMIKREQELRLLADKKIILLENQNISDEDEKEKSIIVTKNKSIKKWWEIWK